VSHFDPETMSYRPGPNLDTGLNDPVQRPTMNCGPYRTPGREVEVPRPVRKDFHVTMWFDGDEPDTSLTVDQVESILTHSSVRDISMVHGCEVTEQAVPNVGPDAWRKLRAKLADRLDWLCSSIRTGDWSGNREEAATILSWMSDIEEPDDG